MTSVSLKPMRTAMRAHVHDIATYYGLSSTSHDTEESQRLTTRGRVGVKVEVEGPKRYTRLIRTLETAAPYPLLSGRVPSKYTPSFNHI